MADESSLFIEEQNSEPSINHLVSGVNFFTKMTTLILELMALSAIIIKLNYSYRSIFTDQLLSRQL